MVDRTDIQAWQKVTLTLKAIADGAEVSVSFTNRPVLDAISDTSWPLLRDVSGCGVTMSDYLPQSIGGMVTLDNSPGSLGFERRFSDLLQRYTIVDQAISIYTATTALADYDPSTEWALACRATMQNCTASPEDGTIRINIGSKLWAARSVSKQVTSTDFPDAPDSSLGNYLPLVINNAQVQPIRITADDAAAVEWAYATTLGDTHPVGGAQEYYTKDALGNWVSITSVSSVSTAIDSNTPATDASVGFHPDIEYAAYNIAPAYSYLLTHVAIGCIGAGLSTVNAGTLNVRIYEANQARGLEPLGSPIAEASVADTEYATEIATTSDYVVTLPLSKPVVMRAASSYWISVTQSVDDVDWDTSFILRRRSSAAAINVAFKGTYISSTFESSNSWSTYVGSKTLTTKNDITWWLYGAKITDSPTPASGDINGEGLGHAYFTVEQHAPITLPGTSPENPSLDGLPWVVSVNGLEDDAGGTITGVGTQVIVKPTHAAHALLRTYNGSDWVDGEFSASNFSSTWAAISDTSQPLFRSISGATRGSITLSQLLADICRSGGARIGLIQSATTPLGVWVYGTTETAVATITDEAAIVRRIDWAGADTVVNRIRARANWQLVTADAVTHSAQGSLNDYADAIMRGVGTDAMADWLCTESVTAYGEHYLADEAFPFTTSGTSLLHMTDVLLRKFCKPHLFVELELPLTGYSSIKIFDIVNIIHPALPSYLGTSAAARLPTYAGTEVDVLQGQYFKRADLYRAQVEGRAVEFDKDGFPRLKLICRILDNSKDLT